MATHHGACTLEQHEQHVRALLAPLAQHDTRIEHVALTDADVVGRICAHDAVALLPSPVFDNSQMDGYAVRASDLESASEATPVTLPLGTTTAAGDAPVLHESGTASPVMTGAAIPVGADAVVPIENTVAARFPVLRRAHEPEVPPSSATFTAPVTAGTFVRNQGEDRPAGVRVLTAGARLSPARIGAAAAAGLTHLAVRARVRVLLCTTGDEVGGDDAGHRAGSVPDSNGPMLAAALRAAGASVTMLHTPDDTDALRAALLAGAATADLIITTGGISVGAYEVVREALTPLGVDFHAVAIQPGGPQGSGTIELVDRQVPVVCFPGNPVSCLLSAELFVLPTLRAIAGFPERHEPRERVLAHDVHSPEHKHQIRRAQHDDHGNVTVSAPGSHLIHDLADADLLVHVPIGIKDLSAGTPVLTWRIND